MVRLTLAGADSRIAATLCASCPHSPAGCCAGPPRYDWSDLGRVVVRGGLEWLLAEFEARRLASTRDGAAIRERKWRSRAGGPRVAACAYHDERGCTITPSHRPATCNYYVCDAALDAAHEGVPDEVPESERRAAATDATRAHSLQAELAARFAEWDAALAAEVLKAWPEGPPFDRDFCTWLGARFEALASASG